METEILFETERLFLRNFTLKDLKWFHTMGMDQEVMKYIRQVNYDIGKSQRELEELIKFTRKYHSKGYWIACGKAGKKPLGIMTLRFLEGRSETELGYRWSRGSWGKGFATEAAQSLVRFGFETPGLPKMVAVVHPENGASSRVLKKCGFQFKEKSYFYNNRVDYYEVRREDFFQSPETEG